MKTPRLLRFPTACGEANVPPVALIRMFGVFAGSNASRTTEVSVLLPSCRVVPTGGVGNVPPVVFIDPGAVKLGAPAPPPPPVDSIAILFPLGVRVMLAPADILTAPCSPLNVVTPPLAAGVAHTPSPLRYVVELAPADPKCVVLTNPLVISAPLC